MMKKTLRRFVDSTLVPLTSYLASRLPPWQVVRDALGRERELDRLRAQQAARTPGNPALHGFKVFSQNDEDGIVEEILDRITAIRPPSRTCLEIGCGNGVENITHYMLLKGWKGFWIDGDPQNLELIRAGLGGLDFADLRAQQCFVDLANVAELIAESVAFLGTNEPDVFSLDVDGNDLFLLEEALRHFSPRLLCVEYNPKFPPPCSVAIQYSASHVWEFDDYHGASLQAFCDGLPGYRLVGCNLCGVNAFFVRQDLAAGFAPSPPDDLYQPYRPHLTGGASGHPPTLKWLRDRLTVPQSSAGSAPVAPAR